MARLIQNEDIKTAADLVAAGGTAAQLPNDTKVWITANSLNETLHDAIVNGDIGGGGGGSDAVGRHVDRAGGRGRGQR